MRNEKTSISFLPIEEMYRIVALKIAHCLRPTEMTRRELECLESIEMGGTAEEGDPVANEQFPWSFR